MLESQVRAREIRDRLWRPVGGIQSSDMEVLSGPGLRRQRLDMAVEAAGARVVLAREIDARARSIFELLQGERVTPPPAIPTMPTILRAVCSYFDISMVDIRSDRRMAYIVRPRHVAMYLGRHLTTLSLPAIGLRLGRKDHTTVLFGARKIERLILVDERLSADIDNIKWELGIR